MSKNSVFIKLTRHPRWHSTEAKTYDTWLSVERIISVASFVEDLKTKNRRTEILYDANSENGEASYLYVTETVDEVMDLIAGPTSKQARRVVVG